MAQLNPQAKAGQSRQTVDESTGADAGSTERTGPYVPSATIADELQIPGYQILAELGRGGMGVVYRARQVKLNREVALKTIGSAMDPVTVARFWAEAEVMAAVHHPHVVQVFELGEVNGSPFLAMELLSGGSLADYLKEKAPMRPIETARLMAKIAGGVAAAHDTGVVHRDIKPGNVLLDSAGEPKVTDFGLAKRATSDLTRTDVVMGTPSFMAPEQASGNTKFVGPQADVWALGVILYQCLTGKRPFAGPNFQELLAQILTRETQPLPARTPRDLRVIFRKCLEKNPADRYATANELAEDLRRFADGKPIIARPAGPMERTYKWAKRKPTAAAAWALLLLVLLSVPMIASLTMAVAAAQRERNSANQERINAEDARNEASSARDQAVQDRNGAVAARKDSEKARGELAELNAKIESFSYGRSMQLAYQEIQANNIVGAMAMLAECPPALRGWEWHYLNRLCNPQVVSLRGHGKFISHVEFSPDGKLACTGSGDHTARIWDIETGAELHKLARHTGPIYNTRFSPDGTLVLTEGTDGTTKVWNVKSGALMHSLPNHYIPFQVGKPAIGGAIASWSPDNSSILLRGDGNMAKVWDAKSGKIKFELKGHEKEIQSLAFSPDGAHIVTSSRDLTAKIWNAQTGAERHTLKKVSENPVPLLTSFSPDGKRLLTSGSFETTKIVEVQTGAIQLELKDEVASIGSFVGWSPDGTNMVFAHLNQTVVRDSSTGTPRFKLATNSHSVAFSADGSRFLTTNRVDFDAQVWDARTGANIQTFKGHSDQLSAAAISADGGKVILCRRDGIGRIMAVGGNADPSPRSVTAGTVMATALSKDGTLAALGGTDRIVSIVDTRSGRVVHSLRGHTGNILRLEFNADSSRVLSAAYDGTARVWDTGSGACIHTLGNHPAMIMSALFSPDGSRALTCDGSTIRTWDMANGLKLGEFADSLVVSVAFSPDGTKIVSNGARRTIRVRDAVNGQVFWTEIEPPPLIPSPSGISISVLWTPDGKQIVASSTDRVIRLRDAKTGKIQHTLAGHTELVVGLTFSADGNRLMSGSHDRTARVWDLKTGKELLSLGGNDTGVQGWFGVNDSRILLANGDRLRLWDAKTGADLLALKLGIGSVKLARFTPDGERIVVLGTSGGIRILDAKPIDRTINDKGNSSAVK